MIAFLTLTLSSLMESTKIFPQFMGVFCITHTIDDILTKALVECIFYLCIPPVVLLLVTYGVSVISDFRKPSVAALRHSTSIALRYASMWIF
jgi:hypothetical protein